MVVHAPLVTILLIICVAPQPFHVILCKVFALTLHTAHVSLVLTHVMVFVLFQQAFATLPTQIVTRK